MLKIPYNMIIEKIKEKVDISDAEIEKRVNEKLEELSGLVSREGAAHIIANELGIKLFEQVSGRLQIKNILAGMRNVEVTGRVVEVYEVREFNKDNRHGKVGNFVIGDGTGLIRVVCWGNIADNINNIKTKDIVKINRGYAKENNNKLEIHANEKSGIIINPNDKDSESIGEVKETSAFKRKSIAELKEDEDDVELFGTVVQVWEPRFFEICPKCRKRAKQSQESFVCEQHDIIEPFYSYFLSLFLDDGTGTIRAVFFKSQVERLINKSYEEILSYKDNIPGFDEIKKQIFGMQVKLQGRVTKNKMFDRIEFLVNRVYLDIDPEEEIKRLEKEFQNIGAYNEEIDKEMDKEADAEIEEIG